MDSGSGKHRRHSLSRKKSKRSSTGRSRRRVPTQSFNAAPLPSSKTIRFPGPKPQTPVFWLFLAAFFGVFGLILLGGSHNAIALGVALILPGVAMLLRPPQRGLGKWGDRAAVGFLGALLFAFVPQFYWPDPAWRSVALGPMAIDLPHSLSVQPWISFDAWLLALAGVTWFYAAIQWPINFEGRKWLFFWLSIILSCFAAVVIWGNLAGVRYPTAQASNAFSFFPNRNQTANFIALGGIATFAYALESLRHRMLLPLVGIICSALCLVALVLGVARAGVLLYFLGVLLCFIFSLRARSLPRLFKFGFPLVVLAFSFVISSNERTVDRIVEFVGSGPEITNEFRFKIYNDTSSMVFDAPVAGFGLGTFSAVFPQYRDESANHMVPIHPESDLFWLASEGGLLSVALLAVFLASYFSCCRGMRDGRSGSYRSFAVIAVVVFLLHALVDVPGHRPGTVYFAILFAALALPRKGTHELRFSPLLARTVGGVLVVFGALWVISGAFNLPLHSAVRLANYEESIRTHISVADYPAAIDVSDAWIELSPMDWRAYSTRAQLTLAESGDRAQVSADFRRARFVERILGAVTFEEGQAWWNVDSNRAISAWRSTLYREVESREGLFLRMLREARGSPEKLEGIARLSQIEPEYRTLFLRAARDEQLVRELNVELSMDPSLSRFTKDQRTAILRNWIKRGESDSAERFLRDYGDSLDNVWWLWSLLRKGQADFREAVDYVRSEVDVPPIPEVEIEDSEIARLTREYAVAPKDIVKGTALLYIYIGRGEYAEALPVLDRMLESHKPPLYVYYWRAECLYRVEEYIESWYAFETYLDQLWEKD